MLTPACCQENCWAAVAFQANGAGLESRGDRWHAGGVGDGSDRVAQQHSRRGVRPALCDADQGIVVAANPHQVVGERQVGKQLPLAHHGVQMVDGAARQDGVFGEQVTEGGHRSSPL